MATLIGVRKVPEGWSARYIGVSTIPPRTSDSPEKAVGGLIISDNRPVMWLRPVICSNEHATKIHQSAILGKLVIESALYAFVQGLTPGLSVVVDEPGKQPEELIPFLPLSMCK